MPDRPAVMTLMLLVAALFAQARLEEEAARLLLQRGQSWLLSCWRVTLALVSLHSAKLPSPWWGAICSRKCLQRNWVRWDWHMFGFDVLGCWDSEKNWKGVGGEWGYGGRVVLNLGSGKVFSWFLI
jgi:hypothetical protein